MDRDFIANMELRTADMQRRVQRRGERELCPLSCQIVRAFASFKYAPDEFLNSMFLPLIK